MADPMKQVQLMYADHRWFVIGGLAALAGSVMAFLQLRKGASVGISATAGPTSSAPVGSGPTTLGAPFGFGVSDISAAMAAGAAAATSGLQVGADLGSAALGLAGQVVGSESDALAQLAGSQSGMGQTMSDLLRSLIPGGLGQSGGLPVPTPPVYYQPGPIPQPVPPVGTPTPPVKVAPPVVTPTPPASSGKTYRVVRGDTLSGIAAAHGTTWPKLYALNRSVIGSNPNLIRVGMILVLP